MPSIAGSVRFLGSVLGAFLFAAAASAQLSLTPAPQTFSKSTAGFPAVIAANDTVGAAVATGDFNSDGFNDLAIGVPGEDIGEISNAGAVYVLYGAAGGLSTSNAQIWAQNSPGIADQAEAGDQFGTKLAAGDFNGDGFDDLVVGVEFENIGAIADAGAVHVIYGGPAGLAATGSQFWSQESSGIEGAAEEGDLFGFSLTAGDFNGDGVDDLAVGVPGDNISEVNLSSIGGVNVIYGSSSGLASGGNRLFRQINQGLVAANFDYFGWSVASGDFNNDGFRDLAVGMPGRDQGADNAGGVIVFHGSFGGLASLGAARGLFTLDTPGVERAADAGDSFGFSVAAGDFDGDGFDDLAIGVPGEQVDNRAKAGGISILFGSSAGIIVANDQFWSLSEPGVPGTATVDDHLGTILAVHDFDNDGFDDLVAGTPEGDVGDTLNPGFLLVLYGRPGGLVSAGSQLWTTDDLGSTSDAEDNYGFSLAVGDYNGDGFADVAAGSPYDNIGLADDAGSVTVIYGNRPPAAANDLQRMLRSLRQQNGRLGTLEDQLP